MCVSEKAADSSAAGAPEPMITDAMLNAGAAAFARYYYSGLTADFSLEERAAEAIFTAMISAAQMPRTRLGDRDRARSCWVRATESSRALRYETIRSQKP